MQKRSKEIEESWNVVVCALLPAADKWLLWNSKGAGAGAISVAGRRARKTGSSEVSKQDRKARSKPASTHQSYNSPPPHLLKCIHPISLLGRNVRGRPCRPRLVSIVGGIRIRSGPSHDACPADEGGHAAHPSLLCGDTAAKLSQLVVIVIRRLILHPSIEPTRGSKNYIQPRCPLTQACCLMLQFPRLRQSKLQQTEPHAFVHPGQRRAKPRLERQFYGDLQRPTCWSLLLPLARCSVVGLRRMRQAEPYGSF